MIIVIDGFLIYKFNKLKSNIDSKNMINHEKL